MGKQTSTNSDVPGVPSNKIGKAVKFDLLGAIKEGGKALGMEATNTAGIVIVALCVFGSSAVIFCLYMSYFKLALYISLVTVLLSVCLWLLQDLFPPSPVNYKNCSICVFLPDKTKIGDDEFYQDGTAQWSGFNYAEKEAERLHGSLRVLYEWVEKGHEVDYLIAKMKLLYEKEGVVYFLMTMSSKITKIRDRFAKWHDECAIAHRKRPVLIATIASAPELANWKSGIVRWYVRSKEESTLLAEYLRWDRKVDNVGVFYETDTLGQKDSPYGLFGMKTFRDRFLKLGGVEVKGYPIKAHNAAETVRKWTADVAGSPRLGAFVVGYGTMLRIALETLIDEFPTEHAIPIACVSTLTAKEWQPTKTCGDKHIVTVVPRLMDSTDRFDGHDRNVVFFFAKETLRRILEITARNPDAEHFLEQWKDGICANRHNNNDALDQEHLSNGDVIVHLDIVDSTYWRTP